MRRKNAFATAIGTVALLLLSPAATPRQGHPEATTPKTAANAFKNIQVLKDIPADQLIPSMQFITASLGVECDFCHVEGAFEKDDKKPKQLARKMMQMMFAINKDNFGDHREITCYSCHRGTTQPAKTPVIAAEENPGERFRQPDAIPATDETNKASVDPILEKYVTALGGRDAIRRVITRVERGTAIVGGRRIPVDVFVKAPDRRAFVMHLPNGDSITAYDGRGGWLSLPGRPVREMNAAEAEAARVDADIYLPLRLREVFGELRTTPAEMIDGRDVNVVVGMQGKPPVKLYFDQQSGMLVRMVRYADTPLGLNPTQIDFADYREAGGVKTPFRWTIARPGGRFTIQLEQIQLNVPLDDEKFIAPPAPPTQDKQAIR